MKKLAIIPARYESSRFPGKPLIELMSKSMIQHVFERVFSSTIFDKVVVATDDERIVQHVKSFGGETLLTAQHHRSGTERCGEVIDAYDNYDVVVNIQGDEPLVDPKQLNQLVEAFSESNVQIATLGTPRIGKGELEDENRIKIVIDHKSNALYFSRSSIPFKRNENSYPYLRHIGLYGFRSEILRKIVDAPATKLEEVESLEQLRWLYYGYPIRVVETNIETPNIDVPEDVEYVLEVMKSQKEN